MITAPDTPLNNAYQVGSFDFGEIYEQSKKHSLPIGIYEQIENLKNLGLCIDDEKYAKNVSNNTLFATIINLKIVAGEKEFNDFYIELKEIIDEYKIVDAKYMGFPKGREEVLRL